MMTVDQKIEGILFVTGEPISKKKLATLLGVTETEISEGITVLKERQRLSGLTLVETQEEVTLGTHPELASLIEQIKKDELSRELSKASLETLAIVLYRDGVTRTEIDYIRGVNSGFILRNLVVRGLIEKKIDERDSRRTVYFPTVALFTYLGVTDRNTLPDFASFSAFFAEQDTRMQATD